MKLKYKKIIMLTIMSTMGIGLLTLSISHDSPKAQESLSPETNKESDLFVKDNEEADMSLKAQASSDDEITTPTPSPTPSPSPTPTPLPVYDIKTDGHPKIDALFKDYFAAKNSCDIDKIKSMSSDPAKVIPLEQLQSLTEFIDDYRDIKCYVKKGFLEGTYIVYAYHEIKITGVNTPAPGLSKFYLITDADGNLKIFSGELDEQVKDYYDARNDDADVKELIDMTNKKGEEAKKKDEDLQKFWEAMDKTASDNQLTD